MHPGAPLGEGGAELGDVDKDVVVCSRGKLAAGILALGNRHRRLVHVQHVEHHLDHAKGEPKDVWKLQRYDRCLSSSVRHITKLLMNKDQ